MITTSKLEPSTIPKEYYNIINAFLRGFPRKNIKVELDNFEGTGTGTRIRTVVTGRLTRRGSTLGHLSIRADSFGITIELVLVIRTSHHSLSKQIYRKRWNTHIYVRSNVYRKGRYIKSTKRPKFRKFGAYVASELAKFHDTEITTDIMES